MRSVLCSLMLGLLAAGAWAQTPSVPVRDSLAPRHTTLKFGITSLLGPDATVLLGIERPVGIRRAWQVEGGYGWFNSLINFDRGRYEHTGVLQLRTEYRWYGFGVFPRGFVSRSLGPYYAVELAGKQINVRDRGTVGRDCVGFNCGYFEKIDQSITRYTVTGLLKTGWQLPFYDADHQVRFVADLFVGVGVGYAWTFRAPLSGNGSEGTDQYYTEREFGDIGDRFRPGRTRGSLNIGLGARLGYRLKTH